MGSPLSITLSCMTKQWRACQDDNPLRIRVNPFLELTTKGNPADARKTLALYCTFTALSCKSLIINGAGEGNRTLVSGLGSPHSTIEPHPLTKFRYHNHAGPFGKSS